MSVMSFRQSRLARATAAVTLVTMLTGCLPQNLKEGAGKAMDSTSSITQSAGDLFASISGVTDTVSDLTGVQLPGTTKGGELRTWTTEDLAAAEEARKVMFGEQLDDLPVYDPLKAGEAQRYKAKIAAVAAKYKGRKSLNPEEMKEAYEAILPVVRYLAKSRAYQESAKKVSSITRNPKGHASIVVPAGMTMNVSLLTYCIDHGLPAPWSGSKMQLRSSAPYMPADLQPLYKDLHEYAATHPNAHYLMQSTVWWLRDTPCKQEALSDKQKAMIEAARPGGLHELQSYCMTQKVKGYAVEAAKRFIPGGSSASSMLSEYQQVMSSVNDYQTKAQVFLNSDLTNPNDLLKLAQTSGLTNKLGANSLLSDPSIRKYAPLMQQSGLIKAMIPHSDEDKAIATSLSVMEELGRQLGEQQGADRGSLANYSKLPNGLYVEAKTNGGASHAYVKIRNTGTEDQVFDGSEFVLTTVDDREAGHSNYRPTQRLSIGPMVPESIGPNESDAKRRYTPGNDKAAMDALNGAKDLEATLEGEEDPQAKEQCAEREKASPGNGSLSFGDFGLGIIRDVVQAVPFVGTAAYAYSALTGKDWLTGSNLPPTDHAIAIFSALIPGAALAKGLIAGAKMGKMLAVGKEAYDAAGKVTVGRASGLKAFEGSVAFVGDDGCTAWGAGNSALANFMCSGRKTTTASCIAYQGLASAVGNAPQVRLNTMLEPRVGLAENWTPAFIETAKGWFK